MSYLEQVTAWSQGQATHLYASVLVAGLLLIGMDAVDELRPSSDSMDLTSMAKLLGGAFILVAACMAILS